MRILLKPNDVLMFRESRSFTAGESYLARSTLPLPQTITGALRTAILLYSNFSDEAKELAGYKREEPGFEVIGSFLYDKQEYFPTPLDIVKAKGMEDYFLVKPLPLLTGFIFKGRHIHFESVGGFISYDNFIEYLKGKLVDGMLERLVKHDLFFKESRVGIKLSDVKVTEERFFYKADFLRLGEEVKISVWIENGDEVMNYLRNGLVRLGGESRFAELKIEERDSLESLRKEWNEITEVINEEKRFKLYVTTPVLIKNREYFVWDIREKMEGQLKNSLKISRIYPLIGKPIAFSGWDLANNKPKPMKYAVPQGSVYFIEFRGKVEMEKPYLKLGELNRLGFGLCFVGVWG